MSIILDIETLQTIYQEKENQLQIVEDQCDQAFENWQKGVISSEEMGPLDDMFRCQISSLLEECRMLNGKITMLKQEAKEQAIIASIEMEHYANSIWQDLQQMPDQDDFTDGQELTPINSEQIDDEKSDEQSHQFIESVETEILLIIYRRLSSNRSRSIRRLKSKRLRPFFKSDSNYNRQSRSSRSRSTVRSRWWIFMQCKKNSSGP
jgi:predicted RNase H-like nuclease (RuvC/YqgF family)